MNENVVNENTTYQVQDWMSKVLAEFDSLEEADDYKDEICGDDEEAREDIYIIGIDENGKEFAPQW